MEKSTMKSNCVMCWHEWVFSRTAKMNGTTIEESNKEAPHGATRRLFGRGRDGDFGDGRS
jgi:hypothetical protein